MIDVVLRYLSHPPRLRAWHMFFFCLVMIICNAILVDYADNRRLLYVTMAIQIVIIYTLIIDLVRRLKF